MPITKDCGRQTVLSAEVDFTFADITDDAAANPAIDIPAGAVVVGGELVVTTAFDSTTSDVADIGDGGDTDRYSATPVNLQAAGATALDVTGYRYTANDTIDIAWTPGTASTATAGAATLRIQYVMDGRANENHG